MHAIAVGLFIVFLLAVLAGLVATMAALFMREPMATAVGWGGKSAACVATIGLAALALIFRRI